MTTFVTGVCNNAFILCILSALSFSLPFVSYYEIFLGKEYSKSPD